MRKVEVGDVVIILKDCGSRCCFMGDLGVVASFYDSDRCIVESSCYIDDTYKHRIPIYALESLGKL